MIADLYEKYKATQYKDLPAINPLGFILRKAELGYNPDAGRGFITPSVMFGGEAERWKLLET